MDIVSYALSKKIAEHAVSGVQSMSVDGQNLIINTKDSGVLTMTFPTPKDGVSVTDIDVNANNQIVFTMSDGTEFISGKIPTVKGDAGFSPIITENADNTDKIYKLDITTADSTFTTPNLKGGAGGSGEENKINSISVNGINIAPDENKNVDITVPTVTNDLTDELKSSYDDAVTEKHTHDNKTVLDNITAEKVESWNKAEENVQSDWNETDDTADGFIKNKPTIPDAYDDTALSGRVDNVETSIGDMSLIEIKSVSDLVSAINALYNAFMSSINYADKKLTITYRNGGTVDIDMSAIITDTNIGELSNIDDTGVADKQVLSYDTATNKYIPTTIDTAGVLADAKKYTDDEIAKINNADAISVDEKPIYSNGTITYKKDGVEKTITDGDFWFFYTVDDMAYQTIWIDGVEFTTSVDGSIDFKDFVSKTNDLASTYTGEETDKTKVTTIASLDALYAIISTALGKKINTADIVDSLISDATDKPLSAAQGKALDTKISNFVTTVEEDYAKTTDIPTTLPANGGNSDTVNNYTVETDVPVDAVFTDTIYDDTEVKESIAELNSNLDRLEFGEVAGVRNLFEDEIKWMENITVTRGTKSVSDGKITLTATSDDCYTDHDGPSWKNNGIKTIPCKPNTTYTLSWECKGDSEGNIYIFENGSTNNMRDTINKAHKLSITTSADAEYLTVRVGVRNSGTSITYWNFQLEEGDIATPYEPYIPSVKMLSDEVSAQKNELDALEHSDVAGGKNICKALDNGVINEITLIKKDVSTIIISGASGSRAISKNFNVKKGVTYTATFFTSSINITGFLWNSIKQVTAYTFGSSKTITFTPTEDETLSFAVTLTATVSNAEISMQVEKGSKSTSFEPYIPSVKMLAEKPTQIDDLNVLGWVVPEEMPIKNYTDSSGVFHQIVGRVDLGTLNWIYDVSNAQFYTDIIPQIKQDEIWIYDVYCSKYTITSYGDKRIALNGGRIYIADSSYTDGDSLKHNLRGVYLYFELSTPITMNIDGNEAVTKLKNELIVLEATSTIDMTASRELDDITSSPLTIPSGYKPIAMYGYNEENNDNISAIPLLVRNDGKVLFHAKNHSTSDQGIIHFRIRVTFKKVS